MTTQSTLPVYFISHGGGPWPWMPQQRDTLYRELGSALAALPAEVGRDPAAILMVSAHWEEPVFTVQSTSEPGMIYDYGGFPPHTYSIRYPSPGCPRLASRVEELLRGADIACASDPMRGYDHGMFSPMAMIYPQANVPVVQLSLRSGLDPAEHLALGRALKPLRDEDVLIIGSGLSYHNLRMFNAMAAQPSEAFDTWLNEAVVGHVGMQRNEWLTNWASAPAARWAHPREEHLLPLMVAAGAAESDAAVRSYHQTDFMGGLWVSNFRFG